MSQLTSCWCFKIGYSGNSYTTNIVKCYKSQFFIYAFLILKCSHFNSTEAPILNLMQANLTPFEKKSVGVLHNFIMPARLSYVMLFN